VGCLRRFTDTLSPGSSLVVYRFSDLGNSHGTASLAMSPDAAGELVRSQGWSRTIPRWVPAPLPRQTGLPGYFGNLVNSRWAEHLRSEPCALRTADADRTAPLVPTPRATILSCETKPNPTLHRAPMSVVEGCRDCRRRPEPYKRRSLGPCHWSSTVSTRYGLPSTQNRTGRSFAFRPE